MLIYLYDSAIWISAFIIIALLIYLIPDRKKFIKVNIALNLLFVSAILATALIERFYEFDSFENLENIYYEEYAVKVFIKFLKWNSDRVIGISIYFLVNLFVTYKKMIFVKAEPEQNQEE